MDWNFFSARRRTNLKDFLKDCSSEKEALQKFADSKMTGVPFEEIKSLFETVTVAVTVNDSVGKMSADATEEKDAYTNVQDIKNLTKKVAKNVSEKPGN